MADPLTIRLDPDDRVALEMAARGRGKGLSAFVREIAERIEPASGSRAEARCWALAHHVTSVSMHRVNPAGSEITPEQLASIRRRIALAVGASDTSHVAVPRQEGHRE
jgi:hypothetical protein